MVKVEVKAGENGKIFGGVSAKDISENLDKQHQIKVDKKKIDLKETIKRRDSISVYHWRSLFKALRYSGGQEVVFPSCKGGRLIVTLL